MSKYYYPSISPEYYYIQPSTNSNYNDYGDLYGYTMLSDIYRDLINLINGSDYKLAIKPSTDSKIKYKLEQLKNIEDDLRKYIIDSRLKKELQSQSRGYIDPARIPDEALPSIFQKHSNLLGMTSSYNTKVKNLVNILQKINDIVAEKSNKSKYGISMSINYPIYPISSNMPTRPWLR